MIFKTIEITHAIGIEISRVISIISIAVVASIPPRVVPNMEHSYCIRFMIIIANAK